MASYRYYLHSVLGIIGRGDFDVADDMSAIKLMDALTGACSDMTQRYELWCGRTLVREAGVGAVPLSRTEVAEHLRDLIADVEISLRDSRWKIAESKRLLETLDAWRT
jgi:hypothetical protein